MATFAARKLGYIAENVAHILAIELLAAAQGVDLRAPHQTVRVCRSDEDDARGSRALRSRSLLRTGYRGDGEQVQRRDRDIARFRLFRKLRSIVQGVTNRTKHAEKSLHARLIETITYPSMSTPAYQEIKDHILTRIHSGEWKEGDQVPSENELAREFKVARMTVNRALRELTAEQILTRVQGAGTFVAQPRYESTLVEIRSISDEITARGHRHRAECCTWARPCRRPSRSGDAGHPG